MIRLKHRNPANHFFGDCHLKDLKKERYAASKYTHFEFGCENVLKKKLDGPIPLVSRVFGFFPPSFCHRPILNIHPPHFGVEETQNTNKHPQWFLFLSVLFPPSFFQSRVLCCCRHCSISIIRRTAMRPAVGRIKPNCQTLWLNAVKLAKWLY